VIWEYEFDGILYVLIDDHSSSVSKFPPNWDHVTTFVENTNPHKISKVKLDWGKWNTLDIPKGFITYVNGPILNFPLPSQNVLENKIADVGIFLYCLQFLKKHSDSPLTHSEKDDLFNTTQKFKFNVHYFLNPVPKTVDITNKTFIPPTPEKQPEKDLIVFLKDKVEDDTMIEIVFDE
jgi:hypothetical protein